MSIIPAEHHQPTRSKDIARQRLTAGRQEIMLYTHLLQASLVVERENPLRRAVMTHPHLARNVMVTIVMLLSVIAGVLAPQLSQALGLF